MCTMRVFPIRGNGRGGVDAVVVQGMYLTRVTASLHDSGTHHVPVDFRGSVARLLVTGSIGHDGHVSLSQLHGRWPALHGVTPPCHFAQRFVELLLYVTQLALHGE